jgi:hypothetical protein
MRRAIAIFISGCVAPFTVTTAWGGTFAGVIVDDTGAPIPQAEVVYRSVPPIGGKGDIHDKGLSRRNTLRVALLGESPDL